MSQIIDTRYACTTPVSYDGDAAGDWWMAICEEELDYGKRREERLLAALAECLESIEILEGARHETLTRLHTTLAALRSWLAQHADEAAASLVAGRHLANLLDLLPDAGDAQAPRDYAAAFAPAASLEALAATWPGLQTTVADTLPDELLMPPADWDRLLHNLVAAVGAVEPTIHLDGTSVVGTIDDLWELSLTVTGDAGSPGGPAGIDPSVATLTAAGLAAAARLAGTWGGTCETDHSLDGSITCRCTLRLCAAAPAAGC